jgi:hypothetical protein
VPNGRDSVSDEVFEFSAFEWSWHDLTFRERPKRLRIADFATQFDGFDQSFEVGGITEGVGVNSDRIDRIPTSDADLS